MFIGFILSTYCDSKDTSCLRVSRVSASDVSCPLLLRLRVTMFTPESASNASL